MKTRHDNMLACAQFLRTNAEPKLFYKPYELTADDEDEIGRQVKQVESETAYDLEDFDSRRKLGLEELGRLEKEEEESSKPVGTEPAVKSEELHSPNDTANVATTTNVNVQVDEKTVVTPEGPRDDIMDEHQGETVVEADEDTVIY
jgi:hypothetical protein